MWQEYSAEWATLLSVGYLLSRAVVVNAVNLGRFSYLTIACPTVLALGALIPLPVRDDSMFYPSVNH